MKLVCHDGVWAVCAAGAALAAIGAVLLWRRHWRAKSRRWWMAGVVLPLIAGVAALLAVAGISWIHQRPAEVVMLVDFSASTRSSPWRNPGYVRQLAARRLGNSAHVTVVGFGAGAPRVLGENLPVTDAAAWPASWPQESILALGTPPDQHNGGDAAAGLAAALQWPGSHASMNSAARWIITDGLIDMNAAGKAEPPANLAWTILPPAAIDAAVCDVRVRRDAASNGVEILGQVRVVGRPGSTAGANGAAPVVVHVDIFRDDRRIASQDVEFHAQAGASHLDSQRWIIVKDDLAGAGGISMAHRYQVEARLAGGAAGASQADGDLWPENDRGEAVWPGEASSGPRVLVVGEKPPRALIGATEYVPAERFFGDVRNWVAEGVQAIVLDDVPAETISADATGTAVAPDRGNHAQAELHPLSADAARALEQFVKQTGGGLLILSNGHAFGPGHYGEGGGTFSAGDILEALSPVASHPQNGGALHVVFLLDASASMNEAVAAGGPGAPGGVQRKFTLLEQGVAESVGLLAADDRLDLIAFNDHAMPLFSGPAAELRGEMLSHELAGVHPQGATVPDVVLDLLAGDLRNGGGLERRLVILLTDGEIPAMNLQQWKTVITRAGADFCAVAPADRGPLDSPLKRLAADLGNQSIWLKTDDPAQWAGVLRRELAGQVRGTIQHTPLSYEVPPEAAPAMRARTDQWTQVWSKPEAVVLVSGREAEPRNSTAAAGEVAAPVLAAWAQRGLGRVGAIAMSEDDSPGYAAALAAMLKRVAAGPGDRRFHVQALRRDGAWLVSADGAELPGSSGTRPSAGFLDGQTLLARLITAEGGTSRDIPLPQTAPGHYETRIDLPGGLSATILRQPPHGPPEIIGRLQTADVQTTEWPASMDPQPPPEGRILPVSPDDPARWHPLAETSTPLAVPLWLIAMAAGLLALLLRR